MLALPRGFPFAAACFFCSYLVGHFSLSRYARELGVSLPAGATFFVACAAAGFIGAAAVDILGCAFQNEFYFIPFSLKNTATTRFATRGGGGGSRRYFLSIDFGSAWTGLAPDSDRVAFYLVIVCSCRAHLPFHATALTRAPASPSRRPSITR